MRRIFFMVMILISLFVFVKKWVRPSRQRRPTPVSLGSSRTELQRGHGVGGERFDIDALQGAHREFVGGEEDFLADFDAGLAALAEVPVGKVAEEDGIG